MLTKKMCIEKLSKERVFILFPSLYDIFDSKVKCKIKAIAEYFSKELFIKITSRDAKLTKIINEMPFVKNIHIEKKRNENIIYFKLLTLHLVKVLDNIDPEITSMEAYAINSMECVKNIKINSDMATFYMFVSDNDGPSIIFDKKIYDFRSTLSSIKTILD